MICDSCKNDVFCALVDKSPDTENTCEGYSCVRKTEPMTHGDAMEIIRLLTRIDKGIQHIESVDNHGIVWGLGK